MTGHTASVYSMSFSNESSLLVTGGADWTVRCWNVKGAGGLANRGRENGVVNGVEMVRIAKKATSRRRFSRSVPQILTMLISV